MSGLSGNRNEPEKVKFSLEIFFSGKDFYQNHLKTTGKKVVQILIGHIKNKTHYFSGVCFNNSILFLRIFNNHVR